MLEIPCQFVFILSFSFSIIDGLPAVSNLPLHRRMDLSVLRQIFNVETYENVPEYEVVQLRALSKRSVDGNGEVKEFHLSAFGKAMHLHLQRNEDFEEQLKTMKVYMAESTHSGIQYKEEIIEDDDPGALYQDLDHMAAVTIRHGEEGNLQMEGTIGDNLVLKPVPADIWSLTNKFFFDLDQKRKNISIHYENSSRSDEFLPTNSNGYAHFVYKSQLSSIESYTKFSPLNDVLNNINSSGADGHRSKRSTYPSHAWPEVLLLVDFDTFAVHGFSRREARRYYVSFLNGVDLRFKTILSPKISLILSGIVIAESREATPYLRFNQVSSPNGYMFDGDRALNDLSHYLYAVDGFPEYDLAVVLTKMDMCRVERGECINNIRGYAHRSGACSKFKVLERVYKIAIVEDKGGFDGITTAAHEIGHLLGAAHDGSPGTRGHPGARRCSFDDGFIMSYHRDTVRAFQWSSCSIQQFRHFLNSEMASCLFNKPDHNVLAGSELPGTVLSLHEQCKRQFGTYACIDEAPDVCIMLYCYVAGGKCRASRAAAEGSHCGGGHICRNGKCVANHVIRPPSSHNRWLYNSRHNLMYTAPTQKISVKSKVCRDNDDIDGGFTCYQFLQSYGFIACKTSSIVENCCHSHKIFCSRK